MKTFLNTHLHDVWKGQAEKLKAKNVYGMEILQFGAEQHSLLGLLHRASVDIH